MNRRRFLTLTTAAGVAGTIGSRLAFAFPMGLAPGIQLYAVREPLAADAPGTLKAVHDLGFREVESAGFGKYSAAEFGKLISDAGLRCPSAHLPFKAAGDPGPLFANAHALGAQYATSSTMPGIFYAPDAVPDPDRFKKTAACMNEIGRAAKSAGLQYAYHNHHVEFQRTSDGSYGYDTLLRETDHDLVKFEIDCGWMVIAGARPQDYFARYPGRFRMLHVKDFKPQASASTDLRGERPVGVELGHGFIDYGPIFAAGRDGGHQTRVCRAGSAVRAVAVGFGEGKLRVSKVASVASSSSLQGDRMEPRLKYGQLAPEGLAKMSALEHYLNTGSGLESVLADMVRLRASQMNGCEYCIKLHTAELKKLNETSERIEGLAGWRSSDAYTHRERAALAWTEAVTNIQDGHAPDVVYDGLRAHFSDVETVHLTLVITTINAWNRIAISLGSHSHRS